MSFDINNNYRGQLYGKDRLGYTTPDADASEPLRPFLPVPYPAPWLAGRRLDEGHPVGAMVVLSSHDLVGLDKSGALVPAGLRSGSNGTSQSTDLAPGNPSITIAGGVATLSAIDNTAVSVFKKGDTITISGATTTAINGAHVLLSATLATTWTITWAQTGTTGATTQNAGTIRTYTGLYHVVQYGQNDVGFARNVATGDPVAVAGEYEVLAAPADAVAGDIIVLPNGNTITVSAGDVTFALACDVIPGGKAKPIGYVVRNVWQFLGGVTLVSTTGGIQYNLQSMIPSNFRVHNYMHEMGTAVQTKFVLRMPWIGATPTAIGELAASVTGYSQTDFGRSFVHFTGGTSGKPNQLLGASIVGSTFGNGTDAGNYSIYNSTARWTGDAVSTYDEIIGKVIGVEALYPIRDFANRVRTQFERATEAVGPFNTKTPQIGQMGGSATRGMDYMINLTTDGIFRLAHDQGATIVPEYMSYVYCFISTR